MKKLMTATILAGALVGAMVSAAEDAYIENTGGQYLNTGYCVCTNTRIEIDFQMLELTKNKYLLSSATGSRTGYRDNLECSVYLGGYTNADVVQKFSFYTCTNGTLSGSSGDLRSDGLRRGNNIRRADTNRHVIVVDFTLPTKHFQIWNGDFTQELDSWTVPGSFLNNHRSTVPLALFGRCYRPSGIYSAKTAGKDYDMYAYSTKAKVYSLKIYEGGSAPENLVMHLVPHVKGGVAGFKDLCKPGRFVQGEIDGACTAGGDVTEEADDPSLYTPRNTLAAMTAKSLYLDTGYTVTPTTRVELDFAMLTSNWATNLLFTPYDPYIIGASGGSPAFYFYADGDATSTGFFRYGAGGTGNLTECGIDTAYNIRRTVSLNSNSVSLITAGYTNAMVTSSSAVSADITTYTLKIGSSYTGVNRFLPMKVYGLKIFESDVLVKDYRPFIAYDVPGLVNSLDPTDKLYVSTFKGYTTNLVVSAGGNITDSTKDKETYLEFDGVAEHSINTEYSVTKDSCIEIDFSIWYSFTTVSKSNTQQDLFNQGSGSAYDGIFTRLSFPNAGKFFYMFHDYSAKQAGGTTDTGIPVDNGRKQFKFDAPNNQVTFTSGGTTVTKAMVNYKRTEGSGPRPLYIGSGYTGTTRPCSMKLYSFKISETNVLTRCFVPCMHAGQAGLYELCQGRFFALTGGKVYGKGYTGQNGDFEVALPQSAKITKGTGPFELACIAPGASSFEWYENGKLIDGATTDSYTVQWTNKRPHTRTYKVVPVYTVFNEKVRGEAAETQVEISPFGLIFGVQ